MNDQIDFFEQAGYTGIFQATPAQLTMSRSLKRSDYRDGKNTLAQKTIKHFGQFAKKKKKNNSSLTTYNDMCAINPKHKVRYILDVYTSMPIDKRTFDSEVASILLQTEMNLNGSFPQFRFHLKEPRVAPVMQAVCEGIKEIITYHLETMRSGIIGSQYDKDIEAKLDVIKDKLDKLIKEAE